ncbi:MAG: WYL domain-containing transcriptional regulator [Sulfurospirillum sp.]|nr:WYL domain-containing transcriptional regulator [Sulfurospirillum sp.]
MGYKHDYDKAMTRLVSILKKLYDGESLSVTDLAEEFNTSTRTIQRDFNEKLISFPIVKDGKKWKMQEGFHLEKIASVEDQLVLDMLEKVSESLGSKFHGRAKHLLSKIKNKDTSSIYANLDIEKIDDFLSEINLIEQAILNKAILTCKYKLHSKSFEIGVKPLKIANFDGFWYLIALDSRNNELKKYHIKSMSNIQVLEKYFTRSKKLDEALENAINIWFTLEVEPFEVVLQMDDNTGKYFQRKPICKSQRLLSINEEDESMEFSLKVTHEMEILPTIMQWIPYIKVVEPAWLRDKVVERVKVYLK